LEPDLRRVFFVDKSAILCRLFLLPVAIVALSAAQAHAQLPLPALPPPSSPPSAPPPVDAQTLAKLDPLAQQHLLHPSGHSPIIVRAINAASVGAVALLIQQVGGTLGRELPILTAQVAEVPDLSLPALARSPAVQRIALNRLTLGAMERTGPTVGATAVQQQLGYDGSGIDVAVIDSGVTSWHDDLTQAGVPGSQRVDQFVDFVGGQSTPYDDFGHGTHVAGIIASNGFDSGGARAGIAPGAHLVVLKVLDASGNGRISDVIAAFDYVVNNKDLFHIRVINLSVGSGVYESYNSDFLTLAAKRAVEQGIVVVAAAGNAGRNAQGAVQYGAITSPGNAPWVLTVGASSHMGTVDRSDDTIAAFSSRGPTAVDYTAKPDIVAPGVGIYSLSALNSTMYSTRSSYLLPGTVTTPPLPYLSLSGTSQATPVVTGTVALMLQANPALTPNAVKAILEYTAQVYSGNSFLTQGAGFLNARGAVQLALSFGPSQTSGAPSPPEWGGQLIWGDQRVQGGQLTSDANSWAPDVVWGAATTPGGQNVTWGVVCGTGTCTPGDGGWNTWGTRCSDASCSSIVWGSANSENVVWGSTCGGADCQTTTWSTSSSATVVWGSTSPDDTVVWGNSASPDDTVVWGNSCGSNCDPMIWPQ
jgi:serine protease AprX